VSLASPSRDLLIVSWVVSWGAARQTNPRVSLQVWPESSRRLGGLSTGFCDVPGRRAGGDGGGQEVVAGQDGADPGALGLGSGRARRGRETAPQAEHRARGLGRGPPVAVGV